MPLFSEKTSKWLRRISSAIRLVAFVLCFFLLADVFQPFQALQSTRGINDPPYSKNIMISLNCAVASAISGIIWGFFSWLPALLLDKGRGHAIIIPLDLFVWICFLLWITISPSWMPISASTCRHDAASYGVPPGNWSVFVLGYGTNGTVQPENAAEATCIQFLQVWSVSLFVLGTWTFATGAQIVLWRAYKSDWPWPEKFLYWNSLSEYILWLLQRPLLGLLKFIIALMPQRVHAWAWFSVRMVSKTGVGLRKTIFRPKRRQYKNSKQIRARYEAVSTEQNEKIHPLARFLFWDMLILVAEDLHYSDIINLTLTSKQLRATILPPADRLVRLDLLKKHTLDSKSQMQCDVCGAPVCRGCRQYLLLRTDYWDHVDFCDPFCSSCYNRQKNVDSLSRQSCSCSKQAVPVCRACFARKDNQVKRDRKARLAWTFDKVGKAFECCSCCGTEFKWWWTRWWICASCKRECRCPWHPTWGEKKKKTAQEGEV